jgi:hypothetical protein
MKKLMDIFDLNRVTGKAMMHFFTINIIGLMWYVHITSGRVLDNAVAAIAGLFITVYGGSKGFEFYHNIKSQKKEGGNEPVRPVE